MTGIEIGFLIAGLACLVASFFISEKLSSSDLSELQKLSDKEIHIIIDKQLKEAEEQIASMIESRAQLAEEIIEARTDRQTNEKILSIEEYANPVLNSINESHEQVMFMYKMLVEKQDKITELTATIQKLETNLRMIKDNIEKQYANQLNEIEQTTLQEEKTKTEAKKENAVEEAEIDKEQTKNLAKADEKASGGKKKKSTASKKTKESAKKEDSMEKALEKEIAKSGVENQNEKILQMYKEGATEIEIAKALGKGIGEIKLVLGLFREEITS